MAVLAPVMTGREAEGWVREGLSVIRLGARPRARLAYSQSILKFFQLELVVDDHSVVQVSPCLKLSPGPGAVGVTVSELPLAARARCWWPERVLSPCQPRATEGIASASEAQARKTAAVALARVAERKNIFDGFGEEAGWGAAASKSE